MGKKIQAEMDAQKPLFLEGRGKANGVGKAKADEVWNLLDKFANYGFNKSPCRGLCGGQLPDGLAEGEPSGRVHGRGDELRHPPDRQARALQAGGRPAWHRGGAALRQPLGGDLHASTEGRIVYALGALKNVGVEAMRLITDARAAGGPFAGLFDFAARVDLRRVGKRALEMLARAGALDAARFEPAQGASRAWRR